MYLKAFLAFVLLGVLFLGGASVKDLANSRPSFSSFDRPKPQALREKAKELLLPWIQDTKLSDDGTEPVEEASQQMVPKEKVRVEDRFDWDFENSGFDEGAARAAFRNSEPEKIVFDDGDRVSEFQVKEVSEKTKIGKVLFVSTDEAIDKVDANRKSSFASNKTPQETKLESKKAKPRHESEALPTNSYILTRFIPGSVDARVNELPVTMPYPENVFSKIARLDNHFRNIDPDDLESMKDLRGRLLSFGHGGELVLEIGEGGRIYNEEGPDFVIYENPMHFGRRGYYHEYAHVGVASRDSAEAYHWFPCDPINRILKGCAGVVPTDPDYAKLEAPDRGGDAFDLKELGLEDVRFIKIRDTGYNHNVEGGNAQMGYTEGFDLDALDLLHAYRPL